MFTKRLYSCISFGPLPVSSKNENLSIIPPLLRFLMEIIAQDGAGLSLVR